MSLIKIMRCTIKGLVAGAVTEIALAGFLHFGEQWDLNQGDLVGLIGWLPHIPVSILLTHLLPYPCYSDVLSVALFLGGWLQWAVIWSLFFLLVGKRCSVRADPERPN
jgi:hypothetical protein